MSTTYRPESYSDVFDALKRGNVPYVIVSGMAVLLHGYLRPVFDLDIVIGTTAPEQNAAMLALMSVGFVSSVLIPPHLATVLRMFDQSERELDAFCKYHIPFPELWADRVELPVGNTVASVVSLDHLLRAKRITGRPHDLEDVEGLLKLNDK
jgi:hypothetical protein